ncbi:MAG: hypothetical protein HY589_05130 [Candidatus Omnitrophica bacterium]|nr:hypothetical protein [Candidatus Omnitrophota bacterium]
MTRVIKSLILKLFRATDYEFWNSLKNFSPAWESRIRLIAGFIPPGSRVVDVGCGRRLLERYIISKFVKEVVK